MLTYLILSYYLHLCLHLAALQKPDMGGLQQLLSPVAVSIMAASQASEGRRGPCFNALKLLAESLQALSWLAYSGPGCGACVELPTIVAC